MSVESITFLRPVLVGGEVSLYAQIPSTGRSSIRIAVEAWRRARHEPEMSKVTDARFTFVAITRDGKPRPLPDL